MSDQQDRASQSTVSGAANIRDEGGVAVATNAAFLLIATGRLIRERASALGHLTREPGLSYSELARRAGITPQSMQATLHQLDQRGAIERGTPHGRGRRAQLHVTGHGRRLLADAWVVMTAVDRRLAALLGEESPASLTGSLRRIALDSGAPVTPS